MASERAFAIWITGLPASGKSTIARALKACLASRGVDAPILESDELRKVLTPQPHYSPAERDAFYRAMIYIGGLLADHGTPVIFDATAHRRLWRDEARRAFPRFLEVYAECPLEICMARDPKGIYRQGVESGKGAVPGLHEPYEPPEHPDVVIRCDRATIETAAGEIVEALDRAGFLSCSAD